MTRFWVAGASGMLGQAVRSELTARGLAHVESDRDVDLADAAAVKAFAAANPFTHAINCAAFTAVDACESREAEARLANAEAPFQFARACRGHGAVAVHVSTDYVFDGTAKRGYVEDAPTGPVSAYGRTKLEGEQRFLEALPGGYVVRTSWLFGAGPCFPATVMRLLAERPEVKIVDDQIGKPTWSGDLAQTLVTLATSGVAGGIYHFANHEPVTWFGFAAAIREAAAAKGHHFDATLLPITTAQYPTPAKRPAWSVLDTAKLERALGITIRPWRAALADYLATTWPGVTEIS